MEPFDGPLMFPPDIAFGFVAWGFLTFLVFGLAIWPDDMEPDI
jgi:hypothetical protein